MAHPDAAARLFVYGSLLDAAHRAQVLGRVVAAVAASIRGYERGRARHFYLRPRADAETAGLLLMKLTPHDFAILDAYEEVPLLYTRELFEVRGADGVGLRCWVYLPTARLFADG